jgi:hypothetical protein
MVKTGIKVSIGHCAASPECIRQAVSVCTENPCRWLNLNCLALAVCCASAQNRIKIHKSEFLYRSNCKQPVNWDIFV